MIEKLIEKNDIRKLDDDSKIREKFLEITNSEQYLEILDDKQLVLGCRSRNGTEILQVEDRSTVDFLRIIRDNYNLWQELMKVRKSAHKQFASKFEKSIFHTFLDHKFDSSLMNDTAKLCTKLHALDSRLQNLHDRLQGVFIVHEKRKDLVSSLDTFDSIIVCKLDKNKEKYDLSWSKEIKYAKVLILSADNTLLHKALKSYGFDKLQISRKKSKNIWLKNHK